MDSAKQDMQSLRRNSASQSNKKPGTCCIRARQLNTSELFQPQANTAAQLQRESPARKSSSCWEGRAG